MPTPTSINDLSQTASSNYPAGSDSPTVLDDVQRAHASFLAQLRDGKGLSNATTLASAATTDIGGQNSQFVDISGTTTITSFGANYSGPRFLKFTGALTLTHNATSLVLPGAANITTAAGDTCIAIPNQALNGWTVFVYQKISGVPLGAAASGANNDITSLTALAAGGLPDNSVLTADIAALQVTGAKIAAAAVTADKLSGAQSGSAPVYGARAWATFDGTLTGTNAPLAGGNITSITRNSAGNYTVNFTTAMPDANYTVIVGGLSTTAVNMTVGGTRSKTTTSFILDVGSAGTGSSIPSDRGSVELVIFR